MTKRKGVFVGAYVPKEIKDKLLKAARKNRTTLSDEIRKQLQLRSIAVEKLYIPKDAKMV